MLVTVLQNKPTPQSDLPLMQVESDDDDEYNRRAEEETQGMLLSPLTPNKPNPFRQGPQVFSVSKQDCRLIDTQSGALEQSTVFSTDTTTDMS